MSPDPGLRGGVPKCSEGSGDGVALSGRIKSEKLSKGSSDSSSRPLTTFVVALRAGDTICLW